MAEILEGETLKIGIKNRPANGTAEAERINHPDHYQLGGGVEVIDIAERLNFNRGNAVKYLCRAGRKTAAEELDDLEKAAWYVKREIQRIRNAADEAAATVPAIVPEQAAEAESKPAGFTREGAVAIGEAFGELCGMPEGRRRHLVDAFGAMKPELRPTWKGKPVSISGSKNPFHATLSTSAPGIWGIAWNEVNDVYIGRKTFDQCQVWLVSNAWLGNGTGK